MGETTTVTQGAPQTTGQSSVDKSVSTSTEIPATFTKEQAQKMVSDALTEQGRRHKSELGSVTKERDTLKADIEATKGTLADMEAERESLQKQIDDLSSGDPERLSLVKVQKELRERERKLKTDLQALETEKQQYGERIQLAETTLREISIWNIAGEYENGDPEKLKELCDVFEAKREDQIRKAADTLWLKKPTELILNPDSGRTSGGKGKYTLEQVRQMPTAEYAKHYKAIEDQIRQEGALK